MLKGYTRKEMLDAHKQTTALANRELAKSGIGFGAGLLCFVYGIMRAMDFGYLKGKSEVYRRIGIESIDVLD